MFRCKVEGLVLHDVVCACYHLGWFMHGQALNFTPKHPLDAAREAQLAQAQHLMVTEHNYSAARVYGEVVEYGEMINKLLEQKRQVDADAAAAASAAVDSDATDSASEGDQGQVPTLPPSVSIDHNYCVTFWPEEVFPSSKKAKRKEAEKEDKIDDVIAAVIQKSREEYETKDKAADKKKEEKEKEKEAKKKKKEKEKKEKKSRLKDLTNLNKVNRELANLLPPPTIPKPKVEFKPRTLQEEMAITYDCLINGIDDEDCAYLKSRYDELLQEDNVQTYWLNDTHWVDHPITKIPDPSLPKSRKRKYAHQIAEDLPHKLHKTGK